MARFDFVEGLAAQWLSRRDFGRALASLGLAATTLPLLPKMARAAEEPTYFTWPGYDVPDLFQKYAEKHGAVPNFSLFGDEEEAFQKLRGGYQSDMAHPCANSVKRWRDGGLLQAIDTSRLSNWDRVFAPLKALKDTYSDGERWFVPFDWGNTSVLYRSDLVETEEESWGLLWDERYEGRLAVIDSVDDTVLFAALYAGIEDPFRMDDADIAKVEAVLREQRPLLRFYSNDMTTIQQALASGELVAASTWNDSVVELRKQGVPVEFMEPKEGRITWVCGLVLLQGAPETDRAYEAIDSMLEPASGRFVIEEFGFGHSNADSFALVSEERLAELGLPRDPTKLLEKGVFSEAMENKDKLANMFESVKAGF